MSEVRFRKDLYDHTHLAFLTICSHGQELSITRAITPRRGETRLHVMGQLLGELAEEAKIPANDLAQGHTVRFFDVQPMQIK